MRRYIAWCFVFLLLASCRQGGPQTSVGYLQITPDPVLDVAKAGVFRALQDSGFVVGQTLAVTDYNAQGDLAMIPTMLQSLIAQNADIIITCGTPCMVGAAQMVRDIPVVFTVSFGPEQVQLKTTPSNLHGVCDPLNASAFVDLMLECLPHARRIGLPYNNAEPNAEYSAGVFIRELQKRGLEVITTSVTSPNDIMMAGQYLTGQQVDAILVAADNTIYLGLNTLTRVASEAKTPVFVTDPIQAPKGAAIGYGANYDQWGYHSGLMAVEILRGREPEKAIVPLVEMELIVNETACAAQGLMVPEAVRKRADRIIK